MFAHIGIKSKKMINFLKEKSSDQAYKSIGILSNEIAVSDLIEQVNLIPNCSFSGIFCKNESFEDIQTTTNPFGLISNSDIVIAAKTNPESLNLIVESILNSKNIVILNPYSLTEQELETLEKLSNEALVNILPLISIKNWTIVEKLKSFINQTSHISIQLSFKNLVKTGIQHEKTHIYDMLFLLNTILKANVKKASIVSAIYDQKTSILKCWVEFDNACIGLINIDYTAEENSLKVTVYQKNEILEVDIEKNIILVKNSKTSYKETGIDQNPPTSYIAKMFSMFQNQNNQWFENQITTFKKTQHSFQKIASKITM